MTAKEVRQKYLKYFESAPRNHTQIDPAPLVLPDDPSTLFTSSGMQPLVPYLMGKKHKSGKRLVNSQPAIRTQDIEEIGDYSHTTFFEMLGNWSLGDYFKEDQLAWFYDFLTKELSLPPDRLWVSVFEGNKNVPRDEKSAEIWQKLGIPKSRIYYYGVKENWWSRTGTPDKMPIGEIGGPDSEVFFEFPQVKHDLKYGKECGPACDCGRFLEIGNSVFMQYKKVGENKLEELPNKNVDFGGGLERLTAATIDSSDVFQIDLFADLIKDIEEYTGKTYKGENMPAMRIISDHVRASVFLASDGVEPSNKAQGYILRRLIRRSAVKLRELKGSIEENFFEGLIKETVNKYEGVYLDSKDVQKIQETITTEIKRFKNTLERGLKEIGKIDTITAQKAFDLYQSYGFPLEITAEIFAEKGQKIDKSKFSQEFEKHKEKSRTAGKGMFKGGLADKSEEVKRLHTATHLLQAALRKVLGEHVEQKGQNITKERSRFDFSHSKKLTAEEIEKVENMVNAKVKENLPVNNKMLSKDEATDSGALHFFGEKYADKVSVYYVGEDLKSAFSKEFCGGPHVAYTGKIGRVKINKQKKIGANLMRLYISV